jgi:hypothetical protein
MDGGNEKTMKSTAKNSPEGRLKAKVIRANGKVEDLGVIADSGDSRIKRWLRALKIKIHNLKRRFT